MGMHPTRIPKLAPYLLMPDARAVIHFLEEALDGKLTYEATDAEGRVAHAEVRVADSVIMLADQPSNRPTFPAMLHLYVPDAEAAYRAALRAGAASIREPAVAPDGDRRGGVKDRWGNEWWFTTPTSGGS
jgi:PhnB protein